MSTFGDIKLSAEDWAFTDKILSSDALAAQLITRVKDRVPTSVIRMSDGERAVIKHAKDGSLAGFLKDPVWLKRFGLEGADIRKVGEELLLAGNNADYLACTVSGLYLPQYRVHNLFPDHRQFIDSFYPRMWWATYRVGDVLKAGQVLILHRNQAALVPKLAERYGLKGVEGMTLDSWRDQEGLLERVREHPASTVLVSGGPSGKPFCVKLARVAGKVVLDVGEAMTNCWTA
ncbi:MAG: hypothetical protein BWY66_00385 [bacterium ADurb.Bin374]|nr:MAG: hypothetical protein BWY66_00385 [bacterium ADurb.Bin374]